MRTLAISTLLLGTVLSPMVFAQDDNALHYNIVCSSRSFSPSFKR
ncbi:hypothetical protein LV41_00070 [Acinetobacter baumannii]|nr:hypothetical protein LV41_00070 [Acinetobacter baumannii]